MILREKTYKIIKKKIINGELRPGQPISEKEIIEELCISRTPFREAVHALNEENLVQIYPNRGIFVRELTLQDITNGFDIRYLLEPYAVELACARMPKRVVEELIYRIDHVSPSNFKALLEEDDYFHNELLKYTENKQLNRIMKNLYEYNHFQVVLLDDPASNDVMDLRVHDACKSLEEHKDILQCMLESDTPGAVRGMQCHIMVARKRALS